MASLQARLADLIAAVGADVKALRQTPRTYPPSAGQWQCSQSVVAFTTGGPASGTTFFTSYDVGPTGVAVQAMGVQCTTALVSGTINVQLAIYGDDGTGSAPDLASGPLVTVALATGATTFATGRKSAACSYTLAANRRYWLAFLYYAASAPGTAPQYSSVSNSGPQLPLLDSMVMGTQCRGLSVAGGSSSFPTSGTIAVVTTGVCPVVYLRAA